MDIIDCESAGAMPQLYRELRQLGLETNIAELEALGYTVVPPEKVGTPSMLRDLRAAFERVMRDRHGNDDAQWHNVNDIQRFILWDDVLFEQLTWNPAGLGLAQYLVGTNCILNLCDGWMKGPGDARTGIHADYLEPSPNAYPEQIANCNVHYLLTDYSRDDGAISFLPGSHRWRRQVTPPEAKYWADRAVPVEAPAGSMVVWGHHTWHGSYPRRTPGLRMVLHCEYSRPRYQTQEPFRSTVTQEALDRNPVRFAGLMDVYGPYPFGKNDNVSEHTAFSPPGAGFVQTAARYCSLFDTLPARGKVSLRPDFDYLNHDGRMGWERRAALAEIAKARRGDGTKG